MAWSSAGRRYIIPQNAAQPLSVASVHAELPFRGHAHV